MLVEQIERRVLADRSAFIVRGVEMTDLPSLTEAQKALDEALAAEPKRVQSVDSQQFRLRAALGVA